MVTATTPAKPPLSLVYHDRSLLTSITASTLALVQYICNNLAAREIYLRSKSEHVILFSEHSNGFPSLIQEEKPKSVSYPKALHNLPPRRLLASVVSWPCPTYLCLRAFALAIFAARNALPPYMDTTRTFTFSVKPSLMDLLPTTSHPSSSPYSPSPLYFPLYHLLPSNTIPHLSCLSTHQNLNRDFTYFVCCCIPGIERCLIHSK